jgi:hypothetical protein
MATWTAFIDEAPEIASIARARIAATGLFLMATLRRDGFPRISPVEPTMAGDEMVLHGGGLWLPMMPDSTKARDLKRDGRVALHTATADKMVTDGDVKLWGVATEITDRATLETLAADIAVSTGHELAVGTFDAFDIDLLGASSVTVDVEAEVLYVRTWRPGEGVTTVDKRD